MRRNDGPGRTRPDVVCFSYISCTMTDSYIVFYVPKSTGTSILGVMLKIILLLLPTAILLLFIGKQDEPEWFWLIASIALGLVFMMKGDIVIMPLMGNRHDFRFSASQVIIKNALEEKTVQLSELKSLSAFEVPAEGGAVKHIVLEFVDGHKTDIFETWVTNATTKDFDKLFHALHKNGS